jgi:aspartyl-tRNA(Asn)/glutamyl-tRNA(Gln) amidotransferase subunit C
MDVRKVASLARLELDDDEVALYGPQLERILEYVEQLGELDVDDLEPMAHAVELTDVFRDDVPRPSLPREAALANAPRQDGRTFVVPAILDGE